MALGLLAGAISKTVEGATALANIFVLPMAFLSGSFFPLDNAPQWLNVVSHLLPLRHLNDGMLDVMVRGKGPSAASGPDRHPARIHRRGLAGREPVLQLGDRLRGLPRPTLRDRRRSGVDGTVAG